MELFTEIELMIMALVLGVLVFLILILTVSDILNKRKEKKDLYENISGEDDSLYESLDKLYEAKSNPVEEVILTEEITEVKENIEEKEIEVNLEEVIEPLILEIEPEELDDSHNVLAIKIEDESLKQLDSKKKAQIELLKLETELEHEHELSLEDTITNLEAIEEENAIISYQELLSNTKELDVVYADDGDEPITINEVFKLFNEEKNEGLTITESLDSLPIDKAYKGEYIITPYVSPLEGLETESLSEIQLENTANLEKLDKEIRKTNEFLNILNELKKNLE